MIAVLTVFLPRLEAADSKPLKTVIEIRHTARNTELKPRCESNNACERSHPPDDRLPQRFGKSLKLMTQLAENVANLIRELLIFKVLRFNLCQLF